MSIVGFCGSKVKFSIRLCSILRVIRDVWAILVVTSFRVVGAVRIARIIRQILGSARRTLVLLKFRAILYPIHIFRPPTHFSRPLYAFYLLLFTC